MWAEDVPSAKGSEHLPDARQVCTCSEPQPLPQHKAHSPLRALTALGFLGEVCLGLLLLTGKLGTSPYNLLH